MIQAILKFFRREKEAWLHATERVRDRGLTDGEIGAIMLFLILLFIFFVRCTTEWKA